MSHLTPASLWIILSVCYLVSACEENITAKPGEDVILPCRVPNNNPVTAIEWTRPNMGEDYVFLYRDEQSDPEYQHSSFKNRVELKDKEMKDGDVSLILKNVNKDNNGRYECHVFPEPVKNRRKRSSFNTKSINNVTLTVEPGYGNHSELIGLITVGPIVIVAVLIFYVCFNIRSIRQSKKNSQLLLDKADDQLL